EGTTRRTGTRGITLQAIRAWDMHDPAALPDPDYWDTQRHQWAQWLQGASAMPAPTVMHQSQLGHHLPPQQITTPVRHRQAESHTPRHIVLPEDECTSNYYIGVDQQRPYAVTVLQDPVRIVNDIQLNDK